MARLQSSCHMLHNCLPKSRWSTQEPILPLLVVLFGISVTSWKAMWVHETLQSFNHSTIEWPIEHQLSTLIIFPLSCDGSGFEAKASQWLKATLVHENLCCFCTCTMALNVAVSKPLFCKKWMNGNPLKPSISPVAAKMTRQMLTSSHGCNVSKHMLAPRSTCTTSQCDP
jgi:hypothetical protein